MTDNRLHMFQADQSRSEVVKGLEVSATAFKAGGDASAVLKPRERAFYDEAELTQSATVGIVACQRYQGKNALEHQGKNHLAIPIATIALTHGGLMPDP